MWCLVVWSIPSLVGAQQAEKPALTGDPATDAWVRITFGQAVDPEVLDNPVWGTKTFLALTPAQLEGARLFMQRCPARLLQLCPFPTSAGLRWTRYPGYASANPSHQLSVQRNGPDQSSANINR